MRLSHPALTALRHRNFRLIWVGLLLSFTGSFMQNAALLWHVSLLVAPDQKGLALGAVGLVRVIPIIIFSMISGVVADAWDRRKLMLLTQTGSAIVAIGLALLAFGGVTALWPVYALAALSSAVGAFDLPRASRSCRASCLAKTCRTPSASTRSCSRRRRCLDLRSAASSSPRRMSAGRTSSTPCRSPP